MCHFLGELHPSGLWCIAPDGKLGARHFISALHLTLISEEQVRRTSTGGGLARLFTQEQRTRWEVGCEALC